MTYVSYFPRKNGNSYKQVRMYSNSTHIRDSRIDDNFKPGSRIDKEERFDSSVSRSKRILRDAVLCNELPLFFTLTFDPAKVDDVKDLSALAMSVCIFFKNFRQRVDPSFRYVMVWELHKSGAIHFHGFCTVPVGLCCPLRVDARINGKLVTIVNKEGYMRWPALSERFGHFSARLVTGEDIEKTINYCVEYISKSLGVCGSKFTRFVYKSHRLARPERVYEGNEAAEAEVEYRGPYCEVAWIDDMALLALVKPWSVPEGEVRDMTIFEPFETVGRQLRWNREGVISV